MFRGDRKTNEAGGQWQMDAGCVGRAVVKDGCAGSRGRRILEPESEAGGG